MSKKQKRRYKLSSSVPCQRYVKTRRSSPTELATCSLHREPLAFFYIGNTWCAEVTPSPFGCRHCRRHSNGRARDVTGFRCGHTLPAGGGGWRGASRRGGKKKRSGAAEWHPTSSSSSPFFPSMESFKHCALVWVIRQWVVRGDDTIITPHHPQSPSADIPTSATLPTPLSVKLGQILAQSCCSPFIVKGRAEKCVTTRFCSRLAAESRGLSVAQKKAIKETIGKERKKMVKASTPYADMTLKSVLIPGIGSPALNIL